MPDTFPATTATRLPRAAPSARGVDASGVLAFIDTIAREKIELHSMLVYRAGAVVAEGFWHPYAPERPHMLHSATKSWTATALGLALGEGRVALTDKVVDFFPRYKPADVSPYLAAMTVEDLLTMRTGHRAGISGGEWRSLTTSWVEAFLREPVEEPPGRDFIYSSASSYMISAIVTAVTGQTLAEYLEPRLFRPLGMSPVQWDISPEGISTGGNGLSCTAEDALKLGVLYLQGGLWEGRRILPASWVAEATRNHVAEVWMGTVDAKRFRPRGEGTAERREGYGYQWWMTRHGGYLASGNYGQQCIVLPEKKAVVAFTGGLAMREKRHMEALWEHLYPALDTGLHYEESDALLAQRLASLSLPWPEGKAVSPWTARLDGLRFRCAANADGVEEIRFGLRDGACVLTLRDHRGEHSITAGFHAEVEGETGMTGNILHHEYQPERMRVVARAAWSADDRLEMVWRFTEMAFSDTVICEFNGDRMQFSRRVNTNAGPLERPAIEGVMA
ncbi:beta-lactamase family protein [Roseomonas sp. GC11]|uniref:serine hydrolase domain-containing protein n=1 Tax=Roseomonas sp. GC11 TaxID=2950546 RepID=UPI00210DCACD|nr:serine hydrolase [Roseomonas sp. GC11]MCQ4161842.1 beta-lactamase family protein [Roseomonas sp. GC11]